MRYDEKSGVYRDCRWCGGYGCIACPAEAEKAYKREFPNGPKPIATFNTKNPDDMKKLKAALGPAALNHAFGPDGGGAAEIILNLVAPPLKPKER